MLEVRGLDVRYGKSHVVVDLDLSVGDGEVLALLGRNGAGKTTTILGILGLVSATSTRVAVDGTGVERWPAHRRVRQGLGYVPSGARCFPNLTVAENLDIAARDAVRGGWGRERVCELFPVLGELAGSMAGRLSGGQRQMLAIGRALMGNPTVLLLDEPTEGLAPVVVQQIGGLLTTLRSTGVAILLAEQNHRMALRISDRVALIEKGRVTEELPAAQARESEALHRVLGV